MFVWPKTVRKPTSDPPAPSSAFVPRLDVAPLRAGQRVDRGAKRIELALGDLEVEFGGHPVDARSHRAARLPQPQRTQVLDREGHIHDFDRVALTRREVDEAPVAKEVDLPAQIGRA